MIKARNGLNRTKDLVRQGLGHGLVFVDQPDMHRSWSVIPDAEFPARTSGPWGGAGGIFPENPMERKEYT
jgi:hypothetical protein